MSFFVTGGTLGLLAPSYVERRADVDLVAGLLRGEFCYVLTARQMGKSSLMVHATAKLRAAGVVPAVLDLTAIGQNVTYEQWYHGLLEGIARHVDREEAMSQFWRERTQWGPLQRWLEGVQDIVRRLPPRPDADRAPRLVVFMDEIDATLGLPFSSDEFFGAIREWYNRRASNPVFDQVAFCLVGVASPSDLIRDPRTTPFTIGRRIEPTDFTEDEAQVLAGGLGGDAAVARTILRRVLYWTGGHPYLTQVLCQAATQKSGLAGPAGVDRICEQLFLSPQARETDDNLIFAREWLLRSKVHREALLGLYARVLAGERIANDPSDQVMNALRLSGIVAVTEGTLRVRNRIYYRVFDRQWLLLTQPSAVARQQAAERQRRVLRRWVVVGAALALFLLIIVAASLVSWLGRIGPGREGPRAKAVTPTRAGRSTNLRLGVDDWVDGPVVTSADLNLIDLRAYTNAPLNQEPLRDASGRPTPASTRTLDRLRHHYDLAGLVRLAGQRGDGPDKPQAAHGLKVGRAFARCHVLHATKRSAANGTLVAKLVLHYENRYVLEIPIVYGADLGDALGKAGRTNLVNGFELSWATPSSGRTEDQAVRRLYESTWLNPLPDVRVDTLDYVSTQAGPEPLLVAITVE